MFFPLVRFQITDTHFKAFFYPSNVSLRARDASSFVSSFEMWVIPLCQDSHLLPQWLFPAGFQEWEEQLEKLNAMLHWWGEILCTAILVHTACCGHQALSSRSFQGAGKEVGHTEALTLELLKSRRVMQGVYHVNSGPSVKRQVLCSDGVVGNEEPQINEKPYQG